MSKSSASFHVSAPLSTPVTSIRLTDDLITLLRAATLKQLKKGKSLDQIANQLTLKMTKNTITFEDYETTFDKRPEGAHIELYHFDKNEFKSIGLCKEKITVKRKLSQEIRREVSQRSQEEEAKRNSRQITVLDHAPSSKKRSRSGSAGSFKKIPTTLSPKIRATSPSASPREPSPAKQPSPGKLKPIATGLRARSPTRSEKGSPKSDKASDKGSPNKSPESPPLLPNDQHRQQLLRLLALKPRTFDELCTATQLEPEPIISILRFISIYKDGKPVDKRDNKEIVLKKGMWKYVNLEDGQLTKEEREIIQKNIASFSGNNQGKLDSAKSDSLKSLPEPLFSASPPAVVESSQEKRKRTDSEESSQPLKKSTSNMSKMESLYATLTSLKPKLEKDLQWLKSGVQEKEKLQRVEEDKKQYEEALNEYLRLHKGL